MLYSSASVIQVQRQVKLNVRIEAPFAASATADYGTTQ